MLKPYLNLIRFDKPIGTLLLLWPTLIALWLANEGLPPLNLLIVFVVGTFIMRSAGCAINDFADSDFDGLVERTKNRPIPKGELTKKQALITFIVLGFAAFILTLFLNALTIKLAVLAIFIAVLYPFTKRITSFPQLVLGIAFAMAIPMAFAASLNKVPSYSWILFLATVLWALVYDTIYAMVDKNDDLNLPIKSTAIKFAKFDKLIIGLLQIIILFLYVAMGLILHFKLYYYLFLIVPAIFAIYQQLLISKRARDKCFKAFLNNNYFGLALFLAFLVQYHL